MTHGSENLDDVDDHRGKIQTGSGSVVVRAALTAFEQELRHTPGKELARDPTERQCVIDGELMEQGLQILGTGG